MMGKLWMMRDSWRQPRLGHKAAFDELSRRHAKMIFHVAHRITRNREDAEDVVQEAFVRAFIHLKSFDGRSQFSILADTHRHQFRTHESTKELEIA